MSKETQQECLSAIGLAQLPLAGEQVLGLLGENGTIGLAHARLFVQKFALGLLLEQFDLACHGLVPDAGLVSRHTRTTSHHALRVSAHTLNRLVRLAARPTRIVVCAVLFAHVQAQIFHGTLQTAARHFLGRARHVRRASLCLVEPRLEYA